MIFKLVEKFIDKDTLDKDFDKHVLGKEVRGGIDYHPFGANLYKTSEEYQKAADDLASTKANGNDVLAYAYEDYKEKNIKFVKWSSKDNGMVVYRISYNSSEPIVLSYYKYSKDKFIAKAKATRNNPRFKYLGGLSKEVKERARELSRVNRH